MGNLVERLKSWRPNWRACLKPRAMLAVLGALALGATLGGIAMFLTGIAATDEADAGPAFLGELNRNQDIAAQLEDLASQTTAAISGSAIEAEHASPGHRAEIARTSQPPSAERLFGVDQQGPLPPSLDGAMRGGPKVGADQALLEPGIHGALPVISDDGRKSFEVYARPAETVDLPKVSIVVLSLGLSSQMAADSIKLPSEVALGFSPYMAHAGDWQRYARGHGHETLLDLPLIPDASELRDEGPLALDALWDRDEMTTGLNRILAQGSGYVAVAGRPGMFASTPDGFAPIAKILADRGVGFVELGSGALAVNPANLAFARATVELDRNLSPAAIENELRNLEMKAQAEGHAIAFTRPYPIVFDRIWHWAQNLDRNRIALVPVSSQFETS